MRSIRIFGFTIHCNDPSVVRLQVHLKDKQPVNFAGSSVCARSGSSSAAAEAVGPDAEEELPNK